MLYNDECVFNFFLLPWCNHRTMALSCKRTANCYLSKDKKSCTKPNTWIVFLRTHKNHFRSVTDAAKFYNTDFKVRKLEQMVRAADKQKATESQKKIIFRNIICNYFYKQMKINGSMPQVKRGVAKLLKKNSVLQTLSLVGGKKAAVAIASKEKAVKKAEETVEAKKDTLEQKKREMTQEKKKAAAAEKKAKAVEREATEAKAKVSAAKKARKADSYGGTGSNKVVPTPKKVKSLGRTASNKEEIVRVAKRKASAAKDRVQSAAKKVKNAEKAVDVAKKTATAVKKKRKREVDDLKNGFLGGVVVGPRRKRRGTRLR